MKHNSAPVNAELALQVEGSNTPKRTRSVLITCRIVLALIFAFTVFRLTTVFTSFRGPAEGYDTAKAQELHHSVYRDYKGIVHCHSHLSHDSKGTFEQIAVAARRTGVDFVVMTDHITSDSVQRGLAETKTMRQSGERPLFIIGAQSGSVEYGLLAFPLQGDLPERHEGTAQTVEAAHRQGAMVFVTHIHRFKLWNTPSLDGVEIWNPYDDFKAANRASFVLRALLLPPGPLLRSLVNNYPQNKLRLWDEMLAKQRCPAIASADAHASKWLLPLAGGVTLAYERLFKVFTNHVLVEQLNEASVLDALRKGRSYMSADIWRDATGFSFKATDGDNTWQMGDEAPWSKTLVLRVSTPVASRIRLLKDGKQQVAHPNTTALDFTPPSAGVYRVEVFLNDKLWIISNPLYIR